MKSTFLLFAVKCSAIIYFAACTSIGKLAVNRSATPVVTNGSWKANLTGTDKNNTTGLNDYTFIFNEEGKLTATKNGVAVNGHWSEDDITHRIAISLNATDPQLKKLNNNWAITTVNDQQVIMKNADNTSTEKLQFTNL